MVDSKGKKPYLNVVNNTVPYTQRTVLYIEDTVLYLYFVISLSKNRIRPSKRLRFRVRYWFFLTFE